MIRTFQSPSQPPPAPPAFLASTAPGAATAARTAAANIHDKARLGLRSPKSAIGRADILIFFPIYGRRQGPGADAANQRVPRFIVANLAWLCHKRKLHRPADQGLPCRCPCWLFRLRNNLALSTL